MGTITTLTIITLVISQFIILRILNQTMTRLQTLEKWYRVHLQAFHSRKSPDDIEITIPLTMN